MTNEKLNEFSLFFEAFELAMEAVGEMQGADSPAMNRRGEALEKEIARLLGREESGSSG